MFRPLSKEKVKTDPKLERSNYKTLEFQESLTILKYYLPSNSSHQEISKLLISVLSLISGLRHNGMKKQNQKNILSISPWYLRWYNHTWPFHSWPTAHQPVPWKDKHTQELLQVLHKPRRNREDFRVAHYTLICILKWPGQVQISRENAMNRLYNIKNSQSVLNLYDSS